MSPKQEKSSDIVTIDVNYGHNIKSNANSTIRIITYIQNIFPWH